MAKLEVILDETLERIAAGATVEECLEAFPEARTELSRLLSHVSDLRSLAAIQAPAPFKAKARSELARYVRSHPRTTAHRRSFWAFPLFQRLAIGLAAAVLSLWITVTAVAQAAGPTEMLYPWKLASEAAFLAVYPDKLAVDLAVAERRVAEVERATDDPGAQQIALTHYEVTLSRLLAYREPVARARVRLTLARHQVILAGLGIDLPPSLEKLLEAGTGRQPGPDPTPEPDLLPGGTEAAPGTSLPPLPTLTVPALPLPTLTLPAVQTPLPGQELLPTIAPPSLPGEGDLPLDDLPGLPLP